MAVYLVQHGLHLPEEIDPQRGLSDEGKAHVKRIAAVAKGYKFPVSAIVHSGKKRALETALIFAEALAPEGGVTEMAGLKPMDDVKAFSETLDSRSNRLFVGHLPFMERLTAYLVTGDEKRPIFQFQNGGIVCLGRYRDQGSWVIRWTLMPNIS